MKTLRPIIIVLVGVVLLDVLIIARQQTKVVPASQPAQQQEPVQKSNEPEKTTETQPELTPASLADGYVYVEYENLNDPSQGDNGLRVRLKVDDTATKTTTTVVTFAGAQDLVVPASQFALYRNVLYFLNAQGKLMTIDIEKGKVNPVPLQLKTGEFISDYLFDGDNVYYLAGPFCNFYMAECDNTLRVTNLISQQTQDIVSHITKREMAGFDPSHTKLYISYSVGDAGCYSNSVIGINIQSKTVSDEPGFGGCSDDGNFDQEQRAEAAFFASLSPKIKNVNRLKVTQGVYTPVAEPPEGYIENIRVY